MVPKPKAEKVPENKANLWPYEEKLHLRADDAAEDIFGLVEASLVVALRVG